MRENDSLTMVVGFGVVLAITLLLWGAVAALRMGILIAIVAVLAFAWVVVTERYFKR